VRGASARYEKGSSAPIARIEVFSTVDPGIVLSLSLIVIFVVIFLCAVYVEKAIEVRSGLMLLAPALASTIGFGLASALRNGIIFGLSALCLIYFALSLVRNADRILKR